MTILIAIGLIVAFFFVAHGQALRWYMLFLGVMSSLYSVYDILGESSLAAATESEVVNQSFTAEPDELTYPSSGTRRPHPAQGERVGRFGLC